MKYWKPATQIGAFIIVLVALALAFSPWVRELRQFLPRQEKPIISGPSASWSEIIATANQEAEKTDKDALLSTTIVVAKPANWPLSIARWTPTTTLDVSLDYYTPSGNWISIKLQDAAPTSTITSRVEDAKENQGIDMAIYDSLRQNQTQTQALISSVKLSPRDVIERTWEEAHSYGQKQGLSDIRITPVVFLETYAGNPIRWRVEYMVKDAAQPTPDFGANAIYPTGLGATFRVDARSGEILERTFR